MAFPGTGTIWMNGKLVDWNQATIHVASHVVHYGSGVFEGARCYDTVRGPACFRLDAHLRRLLDSAKIYRIDMKYGIDELAEAMGELVRVNRLKSCYLRPLVLRGYGDGRFRAIASLQDGRREMPYGVALALGGLTVLPQTAWAP